jgi:hypothetical protein
LPKPSADAPSVLQQVAVPLAGAIWRFEGGALEALVNGAVVDPDLWRRRAALASLGAWWSDDPAVKPLLLARAAEDPHPDPRWAALRALAEHFREAAETKPLLERVSVSDADGPMRGYAMMLLARLESDEIGAILLSRDLDALAPGIDTSVAIDDERTRTASWKLGSAEGEVRAAYEHLADRFGLRLAWRARARARAGVAAARPRGSAGASERRGRGRHPTPG